MILADCSTFESLRDGRQVKIRALPPADRAGLRESGNQFNDESRYRRFFAPERPFSKKETEFYLNINFVNHVALRRETRRRQDSHVIVDDEHYIVSRPGRAEVAFAVDDPHQDSASPRACSPPRRSRTQGEDQGTASRNSCPTTPQC